ncbi:ankyrin repeat domain-containing protein [Anatilimnocola floriformis]|uniref:ankyrin repeat domain-containing protein n=1 Tax=Anatilimnocola floriformis TaxID=2948575 RepID=UPI0020C42257|nr:ankyrin repeat domain-containing protein [Anatilimnocola floriformis]
MANPSIEDVSHLIVNHQVAAEAAIRSDPQLVTATDSLGDTLLHYAAGSGKVDLIRLLVEMGSDINARGDKGETPLVRAVVNNDKSKPVQVLLELGADPNIADNFDHTPIYWAAAGEMKSMAKLLKKHNATIDFFTEVFLSGPGKVAKKLKQDPSLLKEIRDLPQFAWSAIENQEVELVEFLLDHGLDPNARFETRPLLYVVLNRWSPVKILDAFLAHGADPNAPVFPGQTIGVTKYIKQEYDGLMGGDYSRLPNVAELYQHLIDAGGDPTK